MHELALVLVLFAQSPPAVEQNTEAPQVEAPGVRKLLESAASALRAGHPAAALADADRAAAFEPENPWIWYYRGAAHLQLGDPHQALAAFNQALNTLEALGHPDPELAKKIRRHRREAERQVFSLTASIGFLYDTNVSYLGDIAVDPSLIASRPDGGFGASTHLTYSPIADRRQRFTIEARVQSLWYFDVHEFNQQNYAAALEYRRALDEHWVAGLRYDYTYTRLGNDPFLSDNALTPSLTFRWNLDPGPLRPDESTVAFTFEGRDFWPDEPGWLKRDGTTDILTVEQSFLIRPIPNLDWEWRLWGGYLFESDFTAGTEFDARFHTFPLGVEVPLVNPLLPAMPFTFRFDCFWQTADYRNRSRYDRGRDRRRDHTTWFGFQLRQQLVDDPQYGKLFLNGLVSCTDADSNIITRDYSTPFTYGKVVYGLQLEWSW